MCISHSVGRGGVNNRSDVTTIQMLLNLNIGRLIPLSPLKEDGGIGANTIAAIAEFQRRALSTNSPSGIVMPGDDVLKALKAGLPKTVTEELLHAVMPGARATVIRHYYSALIAGMTGAMINTPLRMDFVEPAMGTRAWIFITPRKLPAAKAIRGVSTWVTLILGTASVSSPWTHARLWRLTYYGEVET